MFEPDIIHAHYGLSGLFANFQRKVPVVITFHGSDINFPKIRPFSLLAARLSHYNIFVSEKLARKARARKKYVIQPCGVDFNTFYPVDKELARKTLSLWPEKKYILFSGSFNNRIKNAGLAKKAIEILSDKIELIELKGYSREDVNLLFNALLSIVALPPNKLASALAENFVGVR